MAALPPLWLTPPPPAGVDKWVSQAIGDLAEVVDKLSGRVEDVTARADEPAECRCEFLVRLAERGLRSVERDLAEVRVELAAVADGLDALRGERAGAGE